MYDTAIPKYDLFGRQSGLVEPNFFHVERIGDRWKLHEGCVERHSHPHLNQLTLWTTGRGEYFADETVTQITPNTLCWMPVGTVHGFTVEPGSEAIVLSVSDTFAREHLSQVEVPSPFSPFKMHFTIHAGSPDSSKISSYFQWIEHEYAKSLPNRTLCIGTIARLIVIEALRVRQANDENEESTHLIQTSLLARILTIIEQKVGIRPTVSEIASELSSTPYLINRECFAAMGMNVSEVVRMRHVQEAKRLLLFTSLTIAEVGNQVGYDDPAHFARAFRTATSHSPAEWRKMSIARNLPARPN